MRIKFVWIGKIKQRFWRDAAAHYFTRLGHQYRLQEICLKDGPGSLAPQSRCDREGREILSRIDPQDLVVCLDEKGQPATSVELSQRLRGWVEAPGRTPCFVIGGAFGLSGVVKRRADHLLSLSHLTLPHELARVVLLEQLYRADAILRGLPYHH